MKPHQRTHLRNASCGIVPLLLLAACSGGTSGETADISGSGIVSGPVTGFGSIIANGTRMDISSAALTNDGVPVIQADIDIGDSVVMRGTLNGDGTGRAATVITDEFLKGPVTAVRLAENEFDAMGQTVHVDLGTVFDGVAFETLTVGQNVEVHGALDAEDDVRATRVELKSAPLSEYEVTGFIDGVTPTTFILNGLIVNYGGASVDTEDGGPLVTGMYVDVEASSAPASGILTATQVDEEERVPGIAPGERAEIQGIVSSVDPANSRFVLNGITVQYGPATQFEDGTSAALAPNVRVEVEGTFDAAGVLQAREIEIEQESTIRITTTVDAVDAAAGTVTLLGKTFRTHGETQFEDERDEVEPFRLSDLAVGDYVEIRGYLDGVDLVAARVERDETDSALELRGPVDAPDPAASPFSILGISIATDVGTSFEDEDDAPMSAASFYALVGPNDVVEIQQDVRTGSIVADEVEIEQLVP